ITTNDGHTDGVFRFFGKGHVEFRDTDGDLMINGIHYRLFDSFKNFHRFVKKGGGYRYYMAQAKNWNLSGMAFAEPPVKELSGTFEELGNSISHLTIRDSVTTEVGLFG